MGNMSINSFTIFNTFNVAKANAQNQISASQKMASGSKINSASDGAASLAIMNAMHAQIAGLDQSSKNAQYGASMIQTAEGGMNGISDILKRARELTMQAANDTLTGDDRSKIANEISQLFEQIDVTAGGTQFNGKNLLDGSFANNGVYLQVGANEGQSNEFSIDGMSIADLGLDSVRNALGNFRNISGGDIAGLLDNFDSAISAVSNSWANLGAIQNQLDYSVNSLDISSENLQIAKSRIADTDMAKEYVNMMTAKVQVQASIMVMAQQNKMHESVLRLVK